ncbi:hypothetical protein HNR48_000212 [Pseudoteredinibacter isoporae]|uniref:Uncharacterized protein n=1 Tax=Pseudoteredinibacter isoporae TaxID=570281 RepID=A0A7X0MVK5_9GAMM|nr:hypothetical protein [Pseudoteredinibacter isoporae]
MTVTAAVMIVFLAGIFAILTVGSLLAYAIDARVDHGEH